MRIAIDAMGGDRAPAAPVAGALSALETYADVELVLVGDSQRIRVALEEHEQAAGLGDRIHLHEAPEVAGMHDDPIRAVRAGPQVSARACAELLRSGEVDGVLTMGNTGAAVAAATLYCRRLAGVKRTGIAVPFPRPDGVTVVVDCGANPEAKAAHLHQYAVMARLYSMAAFGTEEPRVGILSIGEEEAKGNTLVAETWAQFRARPLPGFVGNVEAREFFQDKADVVVCDGFVGNVALKTAEGMGEYVLRGLQAALARKPSEALAGALRDVAQSADYAAYGGAPLLGVDGAYVIGHGRSSPRAFVSGVRVIRSYVENGVGRKIVEALKTPERSGAPEDA